MITKGGTLDERIAKRTIVRDDCLIWIGALNSNKIPCINADSHSGSNVNVRNYIYGKKNDVPKYAKFKTTCDNKLCINIKHIRLDPAWKAINRKRPLGCGTPEFIYADEGCKTCDRLPSHRTCLRCEMKFSPKCTNPFICSGCLRQRFYNEEADSLQDE